MKRILGCLAAVLILGPWASADEAPSIQAQVAPTAAHLGDVITLTLRVTHPAKSTVDPPALQKDLGTFEVRSSTIGPSELKGSTQSEQFLIQLQNFTTGPQLLPGVQLVVRDEAGVAQTLKAPDMQVTIDEVPPGPNDKGDIRGIIGVFGPAAWSPWWWILPVLLFVGACAWFWTRRQRRILGPPPAPPVPADATAMKRLRDLQAGDWLLTGRLKEFYSGISDILRGYLENGFQTAALERTTGELMRDLHKKMLFNAEQQLNLRELLDECDLVKFAKFRPEAAEALKAHSVAVKFVEQTRALLNETESK